MSDHTPTPWSEGKSRIIVREVPGMCDGGDYYAIAEAHYHSLLSYNEALANAEFIIKAVNNYDKLVVALQSVWDFMNEDVQSGDADLWTEEYDALHAKVCAALNGLLQPPSFDAVGGSREP